MPLPNGQSDASRPDIKRERSATHADALVRLNELSSRLWRAQSLREGLEEMLAASIELLGADMGHVRLLDSTREVLVIAAHRGFKTDFLTAYHALPVGDMSAAARALRSGERCIIEDVETDAGYAPFRATARAAGFRAVQSTPLVAHDGKVVGIVSTHSRGAHRYSDEDLRKMDLYARQACDFIERSRAEDALRASEARYRAVVENQSEMICRFRTTGEIIFVNAAYARALETTPEQLVGRNFWQFVSEHDRAGVRVMLDALSPEAPEARVENRFWTGAGERWTLWTNRALKFDANGRLLEAQSTGIDISERKRFEEALATTARRIESLYQLTDRMQRTTSMSEIYESAMDAIIKALGCERASILLFDEAGVVRFVASRGLSIAYRGAVEGHSPWRPDEKAAHPFGIADIETADLTDDMKAQIRSEGIAALAFIPLVMQDRLIGKFMVYYGAAHAFTDDEFDVALAIAHQVAFGVQRQRVESERSRAEEALKETDRRKDEFLATLSHELRNPLAPLMNALYLLRRADSGARFGDPIHEMMERQLNHLVRLVDDLLEMSRISRGVLDLHKERIDLETVVRSAVETSESLIRRAGHQLDIALPEESLWLDGDPVRLSQILANLLNNAAKYTDDGGRIALAARREHGTVTIAVRDSGIGMRPELLSRVFEMFSRGDRRAARGDGGLGIGLALARRLAQMHGGTIEARSEGPGKGSEFTVRLPLAADQKPASKLARGVHHSLCTRRILVVDDNRDAADSLGMLLQVLGADVRIARDGAQALKELNAYDPTVVLLDIGMPGMDGYEVARRIRDIFPGRCPALVALTGWGQEDDRRRAREAGFDHHLIKPADVDTLQALLSSL